MLDRVELGWAQTATLLFHMLTCPAKRRLPHLQGLGGTQKAPFLGCYGHPLQVTQLDVHFSCPSIAALHSVERGRKSQP